jgi:hypothetical protein
MTYSTTAELLKTVAAVATGAANTASASSSAPLAEFTGGANGLMAANGVALVGAVGFAAFLV